MKKSNLNENCPCRSINCERHGNCEECRKYHYAKDNLPACER